MAWFLTIRVSEGAGWQRVHGHPTISRLVKDRVSQCAGPAVGSDRDSEPGFGREQSTADPAPGFDGHSPATGASLSRVVYDAPSSGGRIGGRRRLRS